MVGAFLRQDDLPKPYGHQTGVPIVTGAFKACHRGFVVGRWDWRPGGGFRLPLSGSIPDRSTSKVHNARNPHLKVKTGN